ncbi:Retrovirus-related Pol polyprotein from transposon RE1-like protein, partial [Drosera capensis]
MFLQSLIHKSSPSILKTSRCSWLCSFNQEVIVRFKSQATSGSALVSSRLQIQKFDFFSEELLLRPGVSDLLVSSRFRSRLSVRTSSPTSFHGGDFAFGYLLAPTFFSGQHHDAAVSFSVVPLIPPPVKSVVTITLSVVEDYLVCRAQMKLFLMSYGFIGFVDGSVASPPMHLLQASSAPVLNPNYFQWQRIDQMVRSWIFATLSRDILMKVLNLKLAREFWDRLHHRFMSICMARSMELKRKLTSLRKASSDSMKKYLRDIKILADSLAAINSPVSNDDLIEHTLMGLGTEYESLIAVVMYAPIAPSFDDIRSKLFLHEQRLKFLNSVDLSQHQAFAAAPRLFGGRGRFKGSGSGGRSSQPQLPDLRKGYLETVQRRSPTE